MASFTDLIFTFMDFILHVDKYLLVLIGWFGPATYAILFFIIFMETGFIVTPFLPGDSLIFIAGALAGTGTLDIVLLLIVFIAAAIIGDTANYWIGRFIGPKLFKSENSRLLKKEYLDEAHAFCEKHGGKAIILARFVPIVRTFAPCVAGMGKMSYGDFIIYNVIGGVIWVSLFLLGGFFFGSVPIVKDNMSIVIIAIIAVSLIPPGFKVLQHHFKPADAKRRKQE